MDYSGSEFLYSFRHLTFFNIFIMTFLTISSLLMIRLHRSLIFTTPILILSVFVNNLLVYYFSSQGISLLSVLGSSFLFIFSHSFFYSKENFSILLDRRKRWWTTSSRIDLKTKVKINDPFFEENVKEFLSFDLSRTGIFIPSHKMTFNTQSFPIGHTLHLEIELEGKVIELVGKIVRKTPRLGKYPTGIGVQFDFQDKNKSNSEEALDHYFENVAA